MIIIVAMCVKSLWMTLALVCRWEAAYGRDFPNCEGLHVYPLELKIAAWL